MGAPLSKLFVDVTFDRQLCTKFRKDRSKKSKTFTSVTVKNGRLVVGGCYQ